MTGLTRGRATRRAFAEIDWTEIDVHQYVRNINNQVIVNTAQYASIRHGFRGGGRSLLHKSKVTGLP